MRIHASESAAYRKSPVSDMTSSHTSGTVSPVMRHITAFAGTLSSTDAAPKHISRSAISSRDDILNALVHSDRPDCWSFHEASSESEA